MDEYRNQHTLGVSARPIDPAVALQHEVADMAQRARLGGLFYAIGWIMVALADHVPERHPLPFTIGLTFFVVLSALRMKQPPSGLDDSARRRWLIRLWIIVWLSVGVWGLGAAWIVATTEVDIARVLALVLIGAYGTTLSHVYVMRARHATAAISLLFVPQVVVLMVQPDRRLLGISMLIYGVYQLLVLRRTRSEYWRRVALEEEIRQQRDYFEQQSRRDGLTGLPNRRRFDATLASLLKLPSSDEGNPAATLILLDLDHFKSINDRFGHAVGDRCLVHFARCLDESFNGSGELPARLGGEEFAVLLPACGTAESVARTERFRQALTQRPMSHESSSITLTVSAGVVTATPGELADGLLARADAALYRAKRTGRDRVVVGDA